MPSFAASGATGSLVRISHPRIEIDLIYATPQNFAGLVLYADAQARLRPEAAKALAKAADSLAAIGLRMVLLDAFRPVSVQRALWAIRPDPDFVADPAIGSDHSRGIAVDVTLGDARGRLDMGTAFDAAVVQSHHDRSDIPLAAQAHRATLRRAMVAAGFVANPLEWWHYALPNAQQFPILAGRPGPDSALADRAPGGASSAASAQKPRA